MKKIFTFLFLILAAVVQAQSLVGPLHGGTGVSNPTAHTVALGEGASPFTFLAVPASGTLLTGVTSADPAWSATPTLGVAGTTTGQLKLANATGANVVTLAVPASPAAYTFTLPVNGGTNTYVLQTDGSGGTSWVAAAAGSSGANPTAIVGLAAVNGSATTYLRSDGAPALDQTIAPTWTGLHTWNTTNATTNATDDILTVEHNSSGTPAANFGAGMIWNLQSSTTTNRNAMQLKTYWTTATDASRVSAFKMQLANNTALADVLTITGAGNGTFVGTLTASNLTGTNTGDQTITLTGDVTGTGTGSFATTWAASTVLGNHYVVRETPAGTVNGSNVTFTLANTPIAGTEMLFLNGQMMDVGSSNDYTISTVTITFHAGQAPVTNDRIRVTYWK